MVQYTCIKNLPLIKTDLLERSMCCRRHVWNSNYWGICIDDVNQARTYNIVWFELALWASGTFEVHVEYRSPQKDISFARSSWNLSRPADFIIVCGNHTPSTFGGGSWNLSRPSISPQSAAISFIRGSWNLSRPAVSPRSAATTRRIIHSRFMELFLASRPRIDRCVRTRPSPIQCMFSIMVLSVSAPRFCLFFALVFNHTGT